MRPLFAALLVACGGCAAEVDPAPDYVGDARFTEEERAAVQAGAAWLHAQVGLDEPRIDWRSEGATIVRERRGATGLCEAGVVYLDPVGEPEERMRLDHLPGLTAHELAHCRFGFVDGYHAGERQTDGIMRVLTPMRWTDEERAQCAASPKCPKPKR